MLLLNKLARINVIKPTYNEREEEYIAAKKKKCNPASFYYL